MIQDINSITFFFIYDKCFVVTLEIEDGSIGYNLGPELYNVSDGTIYER